MRKKFPSILILFFLTSTLLAQKPVLVVPTGHSSGVKSVSCSADGKYFLTLGGDDLIKLWNDEGREIKTFRSPNQRFGSVKLSPDNRHILATHPYANAKAWVLESASGALAFTLKGHTGYVQCESYSPDGRWIVTGAQDSTAILWDASNGNPIRRFVGHQGVVASLAFSPDGKCLATLSYDHTARIWETATGKLLHTLQGCSESAYRIQFSPDGKLISIVCWNDLFQPERIVLWSTETWKPVREIEGYAICFSPDGRWVCVFKQATAFVYASDDLDGQPYRTLRASFPPMDGPMMTNILDGVFLPDSKRLLLNAMYIPEVYDIETGKLELALKGYSIPTECVSFSPDSKQCLIGSATDLLALDLSQGGQARRFKGQANVTNARYAPDGGKIVSITEGCNGSILDAEKARELLKLSQTPCMYPVPNYTRILEVLPDSQRFVRGYGMGTKNGPPMLSICQFSDGAMVDSLFFPFEGYGEPNEVAVSKDGKQIAVSAGSMLLIWDVDTRQWDSIFYEEAGGLGPMTFYGKNKLAISRMAELYFWDTEQKKQIGKTSMWDFHLGKKDVIAADIIGMHIMHTSLGDAVCSPDGKWLAAAYGKTIDLWHCEEGKLPEPVHIFDGHDHWVRSVDFSPNSRWLISASWDNTVRLWDVEQRREVAKIVHLNQQDWAITTPSGLFDASPGAMEMMYFLSGEEVIELQQLKVRYYEPGLISKVLALSSGELRNVESFNNLALYPEISAEIEQNLLKIELKARNGGIGKVSLFINGTERGKEDINPTRQTTLSLDLNAYEQHLLPDKPNSIALRSYNAEGWLKSQPYELEYTYIRPKGSGEIGQTPVLGHAKPRLFALVVGTSDYSGEKLDLKYADQDAVAIAQAFALAGKGLFENDVQIRLFTTGSAPADAANGIQPEISSKANIKKAFEALALPGKVQPTDVLLLYFSGHGITYGEAEKAQFYYLTKDITSEELIDPEVRANFTVSSEELTEWIKNVPALKQVLILDACNSGKIVESLAGIGQKELNPSQVRAFDKMKDRTGMFILTGSAADKVSFEASQYGQGLLTYSILEGMNISKDKEHVDVMELFQHSRNRVPELARSIKGVQVPVLAFPANGSSFPIGIVNKQVNFPLAQIKPVFVRNYFQDEEAFEDVLGLTDAMEEQFRKMAAKGAQSKILFWDVKEYENAYSMKGRYTLKDNVLEVRVRLFKGKTLVGEEFKMTGTKDDVPGLVRQVLEKVMPLAK